MSFKDKHALETLPQQIAALQLARRPCRRSSTIRSFYARDRGGFEAASAELGQMQHEIAAAEERWLALEMEREQLAGSETSPP